MYIINCNQLSPAAKSVPKKLYGLKNMDNESKILLLEMDGSLSIANGDGGFKRISSVNLLRRA